jgi:hypothetical protein
LLHVEAPARFDLPFVEARTTKNLVVCAEAAGGIEFNDVGHHGSRFTLDSPFNT